ncbi:hypothetical protein BDZ91DRAFT_780317 [Kalaharituber pfeilii]|nr:hypothetical protein BDZ91DRAFT_780317 [Kalaharituber pfeilii]
MPSPSRQPDGGFSNKDLHGGSAEEASRHAAWGGLVGAMRWSLYTTIGCIGAYFFSPVFRGLTLQFLFSAAAVMSYHVNKCLQGLSHLTYPVPEPQTNTILYLLSPQFKVYLFMCPVVVGSMVEADNRLREYERRVRMERRAMALAAEMDPLHVKNGFDDGTEGGESRK